MFGPDQPDPFERADPFRRLGLASPPQRAEYRRPLPPEQSESMMRGLVDRGASGLSYILGSLDKPGRAVRGALSGQWREALNLIPFSDSLGITREKDRVSGRDLTDRIGLTRKGDKGWGSWLAGLGTEIVSDPLTYVTFGAKSALTPAGEALRKSGALKGWSREAMLKGFDATESALRAAGETAEQVAHRVNQGQRIATPAMEALGARASQPLSGLVGVGLPFRTPVATLGSGRIAQSVARGMDAAGDWLRFGNPLGRAVGALFDPSVGGAVDRVTQQGWQRYGQPALQAANQAARADRYRVLAGLDPIIRGGAHAETAITGAARAAAEGVGTNLFDPKLVADAAGVGSDIRSIGARQLAEARAAGLPLNDASDQFARYVHRQALDIQGSPLRRGARGDNLYPVATGSNIGREDVFRNLPGGTARINDWAGRFAGMAYDPATVRAIKKDMVFDLAATGGKMTKALGKQFDESAEAMAQRLSAMGERYRTEGLPFYTPDLAADVAQRGRQHARTLASAKAAIGTIGDVARPMAAGADMVAVPEVLRRLGLKTTLADAKAGAPMQGALVEAYRALARQGAGPVDPFLSGKLKPLKQAVAGYGVSRKDFDAITRAYSRWSAPEQVKAPIAVLDSLTNMFKGLAYPLWVSSHIRNAATAGINNLRSGTGLGDYAASVGIMRGTATPAQLSRYGLGSVDDARRAMYASANIFGGHNQATELTGTLADNLLSTAPGRFTPHVPGSDRLGPTGSLVGDTANLVVGHGVLGQLKDSASRALARRFPFEMRGVFGGTRDMPSLAAGRMLGTNIEDTMRGAQWLAEVRSGATPEVAAEAVNRLHFDYDALTGFERNVMRRLMPFYTFSRKNLPLQVETLATRPGIINAQHRPFGQDQDRGYIPDYLAAGAAIPTGPERDGKRQYISKLGLPAEEAFERLKFKGGLPDLGATALDYMGQLNPLIKGPLEQLFDVQFHTGRRLSDLKAPTAARTLGEVFGEDNPQLLAQAMANTPFTRFVSAADRLLDDRKSPLAKAANLLTGGRVTDVDTEKSRAIEARNALEEILRGQPHLSRYTSFYVKPDQAGDLSPQEITLMRLYSEMQRRAREYAEGQRAARIGVRQ